MKNLPLYSLCITHRRAPEAIRSSFSVNKESLGSCLLKVKTEASLSGLVIISTCNRTELYFTSDFSPKSFSQIDKNNCSENEILLKTGQVFSDYLGVDIHLFRKYFMGFTGKKALEHLFNVTAGLDSMVLGENEILGQVRDALKASETQGTTDYLINMCFQRALRTAKEIKGQKEFIGSGLSYATLATNELEKRNAHTILLIGGSGSIGQMVVKNLADRTDVKIYAAVRRHAPLFRIPNLIEIPYQERYNVLEEVDAVISATSSPHFVVTFDEVKNAIKTSRKHVFIDLAIPSDIDPDIKKIPGIELLDLDYFQEYINKNTAERLSGGSGALKHIEEAMDKLLFEIMVHKAIATLENYPEFVAKYNLKELVFAFKNVATSQEFASFVENLLKLAEKQD